MDEKSKYVIFTAMRHSGTRYQFGEEIELTQDEAERLSDWAMSVEEFDRYYMDIIKELGGGRRVDTLAMPGIIAERAGKRFDRFREISYDQLKAHAKAKPRRKSGRRPTIYRERVEQYPDKDPAELCDMFHANAKGGRRNQYRTKYENARQNSRRTHSNK
jgi:hypothetical protein